MYGDRWNDFPDWILGITAGIWEGRGIGPGLAETYGEDVIVRTPGGVSVGRPASEAATLATLAEFPGRTLLGEDVIWCGEAEGGRLSSHRILSQATHAGGAFAPEATGRRLRWRAIADCWARDGQIHDEWLIRDNGAILRQLGLHPRDWAAREVEAGRGGALTPATDVDGPYGGHGEPGEWGARYADLLDPPHGGGAER